MGQLRNAFRAYATDHASPAAIVERLALHLEETQMATTVCVTFDPYTRELRYASAGHPPPLLLDDDAGTIARLDRPGIPPIGWSPRRTPTDVSVDAPAHGTLVLYTDGLVERRGASLDDGVERLAASVRRHRRDVLDELTGSVITETGAGHIHDDAALLLARIGEVPARLRVEIPADAIVLRELRRRLRAWMSMREVGETEAADTILAVSEACNNAIEHAYREATGTIAIEIEHAGASLHVVVADAGQWRDAGQDETRGRGLLIVNGLMRDTSVVHDESGTRVTFEQRL
jgi:anti-sigma regulatory factor (Ser/Thr protein kinase)